MSHAGPRGGPPERKCSWSCPCLESPAVVNPPRRRTLAAFAPLVLMLVLAPSALATHYTMVVSNPDGTVPAGLTAGQDATVKATISNQDPSRSIGSANLTAPAGLHGRLRDPRQRAAGPPPSWATSCSCATSRSRTARSRERDDHAARAHVGRRRHGARRRTTRGPCPPPSSSGNYSGTSFIFVTAGSDLRTRVTQTCALRFATQPADADPGAAITGHGLRPARSGVAVEIVDAAGTRVPVSGVPVSARDRREPRRPARCSGTTTVADARPGSGDVHQPLDQQPAVSATRWPRRAPGSPRRPRRPFRVERSAFSVTVSGPGATPASVPTGAQAPLEVTIKNTAGGQDARIRGPADCPPGSDVVVDEPAVAA